jgi:hypothetical protein
MVGFGFALAFTGSSRARVATCFSYYAAYFGIHFATQLFSLIHSHALQGKPTGIWDSDPIVSSACREDSATYVFVTSIVWLLYPVAFSTTILIGGIEAGWQVLKCPVPLRPHTF